MPVEVAFYQLSRSSLERALPRLLQKALDQQMRAVVLGTSEERLSALDTALWVDDPGSFLAHGRRGDPYPEDQPIYLTTVEENPNGARVLVLIDGAEARSLEGYMRCLHVFEGHDARRLAAARARYEACRAAGLAVTFHRQDSAGRWESTSP
jgi:DNA polymerase-3 subunit chi